MMRAARLIAPRKIAVRRAPRPVPGRGEALVRVRAVGICRSDLHYYQHGRIGDQVIRRYPQTLGHEPAGEVVAVAPGVTAVRPGDRVAVEPAVPCGLCPVCRAGLANACPRVRFLGMPGQPGALAEELALPARNLVRIPGSLTFGEAAALEPLAIAIHAIRLLAARRAPAGARPREALVVGAGPVGLCVVAALAARGVRVTACDYLPGRLRAARRMGAFRVRRVAEGAPMRAAARGLGRDWPHVYEAGGTPEAVALAVHAARPGGSVALIGIADGDAVPVPLHVARRKELTLVNVRRSNGELKEAARLAASGRVRLAPMLTHAGSLEDAARLFELVGRRAGGVIKAVIVP
jgi:L-iditol 2-dehydrogenase